MAKKTTNLGKRYSKVEKVKWLKKLDAGIKKYGQRKAATDAIVTMGGPSDLSLRKWAEKTPSIKSQVVSAVKVAVATETTEAILGELTLDLANGVKIVCSNVNALIKYALENGAVMTSPSVKSTKAVLQAIEE